MARFRKGTTDHDNDGHKGGSLKAGTRFVQGTMDHDADGKRGGSLPGDDTMAKAPVKRTARKTVAADETPEAKTTKAAKSAAAEEQFAKADEAGEVDETRLRSAALGGF